MTSNPPCWGAARRWLCGASRPPSPPPLDLLLDACSMWEGEEGGVPRRARTRQRNSRAAPTQTTSDTTPSQAGSRGARRDGVAQAGGAGRHGLSNRCDLKLFPPSPPSTPLPLRLSAPARPRGRQHPGVLPDPPDPTGGLGARLGGAARGKPCCHGCCGLMQRRVAIPSLLSLSLIVGGGHTAAHGSRLARNSVCWWWGRRGFVPGRFVGAAECWATTESCLLRARRAQSASWSG